MENFKPDDVLYQISVEDVLEVAEHLGIPRDKITDDVVAYVQGKVDKAFEKWAEVVEDALQESLVQFSTN